MYEIINSWPQQKGVFEWTNGPMVVAKNFDKKNYHDWNILERNTEKEIPYGKIVNSGS